MCLANPCASALSKNEVTELVTNVIFSVAVNVIHVVFVSRQYRDKVDEVCASIEDINTGTFPWARDLLSIFTYGVR